MVNPAIFQLAIGLAGFGAVLWFIDSLDTERPDLVKAKLVSALLFYSISLLSMLIPAATREFSVLMGLYVPPVQVWIEAVTMGFLISAIWDIVEEERLSE